MTVGIGLVTDTWTILAADSRISAGTHKGPNDKKLFKIGSLYVVMAGDWGQSQRFIRRAGDSVHSVEELASSLEEFNATEIDLLVAGTGRLYSVTFGEGGAVCTLEVPKGQVATIGSGGAYVRGYMEAHGPQGTPEAALILCREAMKSCAKHYLCVGAPYYGKILDVTS